MRAANGRPRVWLVRAGQHGQDEQAALDEELAIIGFVDVEDLMDFGSVKDLVAALRSTDPNDSRPRAENLAHQLWAFREGIVVGDIVVLPLKTRPGQVALGRASGGYTYQVVHGALRHTRPVDWVRPDVPRLAFEQDLLNSFGALLTVCRITRHAAEPRVAAVFAGHPDPGYAESDGEPRMAAGDAGSSAATLDLAQVAHDEITAVVRRRFPSHDMARLVEAILQAEGFVTNRALPGPDGGADILAARGPLGLDAPTLCVQVKATETPADVTVFRSLQGAMSSFNATQGLLVCWSGYNAAVKKEARQHIFNIRLWDQSDVVDALYRTYDHLPEEIQAELPLKRVWALVHEDLEAET